ncbi:MAG: 1-deoxy-D-xylulose-5-phosphate reductoisomerase [Eubacteriales bacterium]|nr:1-deoxy-D-xylulose-5-phosphate reductoisomerase [Clostridiales bacterium]MDD7773538.1 1-deoxy-D-xylulose-5-phosphate reductoisomerase [Eubacteriales bacterium]MDY3941949.1 1-deoxy-D-xylulose-5-phosphate reductoisomerase [Eubacteriales bacterium]
MTNRKNIRKVAVLGSTGSVGTQTMDVVRELGCAVSLLSGWSNTPLLLEQIRAFHPKTVYVRDEAACDTIRTALGTDTPELICTEKELLDAIRTTDADCIVHAIAGMAGIPTALAAADSGKRLAIANKEAVIAVGELLFQKIHASGGELIPVDSEHSAIYQCREGRESCEVRRILLTASGGPFFGKTAAELSHVTLEETLAHPTWKMGRKITVDSATLMNKGFEIIEAVRLFGVPEERVEVLVHRQSIIHSMVEYTDNTTIAVLSKPDMRECIRYALTAPDRAFVQEKGLDFAAIGTLTFDKPDTVTFPLLNTAREAIRIGGSAPAALIAADEAAVQAFFDKRIPFSAIAPTVAALLSGIQDTFSLVPNAENMAVVQTRAAETATQYFHR